MLHQLLSLWSLKEASHKLGVATKQCCSSAQPHRRDSISPSASWFVQAREILYREAAAWPSGLDGDRRFKSRSDHLDLFHSTCIVLITNL